MYSFWLPLPLPGKRLPCGSPVCLNEWWTSQTVLQWITYRGRETHFLVCGTCVGIEAASHRLYAPFGLGDINAGLLRPNPNNPNSHRFLEKARSYQARWPHLRVSERPMITEKKATTRTCRPCENPAKRDSGAA